MHTDTSNSELVSGSDTTAPDRKPYQIILIEHLFYPFLGSLFLSMVANYGPEILIVQTDLTPNAIKDIIVAFYLTILTIVFLFYFPFSCRRLWRSTGYYLTGFWKIAARFYTAVLFVVAIAYGVMASISLPMLYMAAWQF